MERGCCCHRTVSYDRNVTLAVTLPGMQYRLRLFDCIARLRILYAAACLVLLRSGDDIPRTTAKMYPASASYLSDAHLQGDSEKTYPNAKIAISQRCVKILAPNFVNLFTTKLCMLRAVYMSLNAKLHKRKL